jgi:hypothetical protein
MIPVVVTVLITICQLPCQQINYLIIRTKIFNKLEKCTKPDNICSLADMVDTVLA